MRIRARCITHTKNAEPYYYLWAKLYSEKENIITDFLHVYTKGYIPVPQ